MVSAALTLPVASLRLRAVVGGRTDGRIPRRRPDASAAGGQRSEAAPPLLRWRAQARALGVPWWRGLLRRRCHRIAFSTRTAWLPGTSSLKTPTESVLSSVVSTSRTLLFVLVAGLLPLSGVRSLPALACAPAPTQQLQEIEEQDEEVRMYSAILSRNPGDVDALKCALYAKMRRADWGGALRYVRRLRDAEPSEVEWRLMVAQLHELKGDLAKAERQFRELLAEEPLLVWALHGLALCMQKKLEGPTVFEMLENALQLATSEKRVLEERNIKLLIAQMHVVMGQLDVASEKLQNLINEDPRDFRSHLCQGIVYALLDRKEDADKQFDIYRSLVPNKFPYKSFISDVILAARMESHDRLQKEFESEFQTKK